MTNHKHNSIYQVIYTKKGQKITLITNPRKPSAFARERGHKYMQMWYPPVAVSTQTLKLIHETAKNYPEINEINYV